MKEAREILDERGFACCSRCQKIKSKSEFYPNSDRWNGIRLDCKECSVSSGNKRDYRFDKTGWTEEEYQKAYIEQDGRCAICNRNTAADGRALAGDHDHVTGEKRSLLCGNCNRGLGFFGDDPILLDSAIEYLFRHRRSDD